MIKHRLLPTMEKTAWQAWGTFDDVTAAFQALSNVPTVDVVDEVMPILKRHVTTVYDRTSTCRVRGLQMR